MITVSNEFRQLMEQRTDFKQNADITLLDGTVLNLTEKDFTVSNNSIVDGAESNTLPLGEAISRSITLELANFDEKLSVYDFFGCKIRLYLTYALSATTEKIEYGTFTAITPETYGDTVLITAVDDMYLSDKPYKATLSFPASAQAVLQDACNSCGIELATSTFLNSDFPVQNAPEGDLTFRQVIGYISMIACGNARINRSGRLEIISYDFRKIPEIMDGGTFNPWTAGSSLDGGTFNPWTTGDSADGGDFTNQPYHVLKNWKSLKVETDEVVITGIQTSVKGSAGEDDTEYISGESGYTLSVDNPLISGIEQQALDLIAERLVGVHFRAFTGDHIAYPLAEFMDYAYVVDRKGNAYPTVLTDIDFTFFGLTVFKNSAESPVRNNSKYSSNSTRAYQDARKLVEQEKTEREAAVQNLNTVLANSSGLFSSSDPQPDGSVIYYAHNKPTMAESSFVLKFAGDAIGISNDGGNTYPYGLDMTATAILNRIYTVGLNANYIETGSIVARDANGNITFSVNLDTGAVNDAALAEFKNYLGEWIRITGGTLEMGRPDDPLTLVLQNNRISFKLNGVEVAWLSNNMWSTSNLVVTNSADIVSIKIRKSGRHRLIG